MKEEIEYPPEGRRKLADENVKKKKKTGKPKGRRKSSDEDIKGRSK